MAYAFGFPRDVTNLIYSMRDWRWEMVRAGGKTPSARCFNGKSIYAGFIPYYCIESDSEEEGVGEVIVCRPLCWMPSIEISIHIFNPANVFKLRGIRGKVPGKFRRLQEQNDRRVKETWFQCEPRAAAA
jgi:hypothetical protein